ncbi:MAG: FlgD immunoglobulin-like domain containing protein, partial [Elusimicrobiota bacterium]
IFSPGAQTYFLGLDIGDGAVVGNGIGLQIPGPSAIVIDAPPDTVSGQIFVNVSQFPPLPNGTTTQALPYQTSKVVVGGTVLKVSGLSLAPAAVERGKTGVALLRLDLQTNTSVVDVGALRLTQKGGAYCTATSTDAPQACGLTSLSIYRESDGNGSFGAAGDVLIGEVSYSNQPASNFNLGIATINLTTAGLPRLRIGTELTTLYVVGVIGAGATLGDKVGIGLDIFPDIKGAGGLVNVGAVPDINKYPPVTSLNAEIVPLLVPAVAVSNSYAPIIVGRSGPGTGYPAYALVSTNSVITVDGQTYKCNVGKDPANARNNICVDIRGNPVADQARWICGDGSPWAALSGSTWTPRCPLDPPYIDINGDGIPDNFSFGASTRATSLSLVGEGLPAVDFTNSGILDLDFNKDGLVDLAVPDGFGGIRLMLGTDATDPGNTATAINIPDQGFVPSVWTGKTGELAATLPVMTTTGYYEIAVGKYYDDPIGLSGAWSRVDAVRAGALSAQQFSVLAASAPVSIAKIGGLSLSVPNVTRLMENLSPSTTQFVVENAGRLQLPGVVYVGSEIMRIQRLSGDTVSVVGQEGDPPPATGRGLRGSAPIQHLRGEPISDGAAILFARFISSGSVSVSTSQPRALFLFRPDPEVPSTPGEVKILEKGRPAYPLGWTRSLQPNSGVMAYEMQERGGDSKDLQSLVVWRTLNIVNAGRKSALGVFDTGADNELYGVGDPKSPGETPRPFNQFYSYRVRAISAAGVLSDWSPLGTNALTGISNEIISGVSNYPNPFDSRKGGEFGRTQITYTLGADADVTITIYDALGYIVKTISAAPGSSGGKAGANFMPWDGRNAAGVFASKGGYIARIKVKAPGGSVSVIRKIGLIH